MESSAVNQSATGDSPERPRIIAFEISSELFGDHSIDFPYSTDHVSPSILILAGRNGSGKTTILRMIYGMIQLNFDAFRKTPFNFCELRLSDGNSLIVRPTRDERHPLIVSFGSKVAELGQVRGVEPDLAKQEAIAEFRNLAEPVFQQIFFELLDIHRSIALKSGHEETEVRFVAKAGGTVERRPVEKPTLSQRVRKFVGEAQINYRKFFVADELELLPRILDRFNAGARPSTREVLKARVANVQEKSPEMRRLGLQPDDADLRGLAQLLDRDEVNNDHALVLVEAYVEMQESRQKARNLITRRLLEFENIMDDFFVNKRVRITVKDGLQILSSEDQILNETQLSSGEYHFLYMMVSALLCQRAGTIIAIDEPELSLHTTWQRKIVEALARCAAGASPLFIFATHSVPIAAEHPSSIYLLSKLD